MSKKLASLFLTTTMFFSSMIGISAAEANTAQPAAVQQTQSTRAATIDQSAYKTMLPGEVDKLGGSASVIFHAFTATRESNGDVTLYIDESFNSVQGFYQHLATDKRGDNFVSSKDTAYLINKEGNYSVRLAADTVSDDGYIYLYFSIAPIGVNDHFFKTYYKIPVDYENNKADDHYKIATPGYEFQMSASATFSNFSASASRLTDGSVEVIVNIKASNAILYFVNLATSTDGDIFMPSKNGWYQLGVGVMQSGKSYRMVLPKENVSADGYVYYEIVYELPTQTRYHTIDTIMIPVA